MNTCRKISFSACMISLISSSAHSQDLESKVRDYTALVDAENGKSPLCRSYEGKVVSPISFADATKKLPEVKARGEYETTNQYEARKAADAALLPATPIIVSVPVDTDFVRYEADKASFVVEAGAFNARRFSAQTQAEVAAETALFASPVHERRVLRTAVAMGSSEKKIGTATAQTVLGTNLQVATVERQTFGLTLSGSKLFKFTHSDNSMVAVLGAEPASAPSFKARLRVAIAFDPQPPYIIKGTMNVAPATAMKPVQYIDKTTLIAGHARCGLILDSQSRVLASIDAGTGSDAR